MTPGGFRWWRLRETVDAVRQDHVARARPIGVVANECPTCGIVREMTC